MTEAFRSIGYSRHRIGSDGAGVTTLVGGSGCPLDCRYCLNPHCKLPQPPCRFTAEELYEKLLPDSLYFEATCGGVTFGGGEPLLQAEFIRNFIEFVREKGKDWRFYLETCLAVETDTLALLDGIIDGYIVDIKDMDSDIYKAYTGKDNRLMKENLLYLAPVQEKVTVKIPLIPDFNTAENVLRSETQVRGMGFTHIERFKYTIR